MNINEMNIFIYSLINNGIRIWVQDEKLKLFVPENIILMQEQDSFIKQNKDEIIKVLQLSEVYSKDYETIILQDNVDNNILSFAQARMWFIDKYESGSNIYNIPMIFKLKDTTKIDKLSAAISSVVSKHQILKTIIKEDSEGNAYQIISDMPFIAEKFYIDKSRINSELKKQTNRIFNLSSDFPIRVCFYEAGDEIYLSIVVHHIAFDGWSVDIFLRELEAFYFDRPLPEMKIQYKDFALWQRYHLSGEKLSKELSYWKAELIGYEPLNLITDKLRPKEIKYEGANYDFIISKNDSISLRDIAKNLKVSLYSVLLSAYYLMLKIYSNQSDIVIGAPAAGRNYAQIDDLIGFFVNSLVLRCNIKVESSLSEFIQEISKKIITCQLHQDLPFEKLVEELNEDKDTSRHPIFQVLFSMQNFEENITSSTILEKINIKEKLYDTARFDLSTFIDDSEIEIQGSFNYATSLYGEETISRFAKTYLIILEQFIKYKDKLNSTKISEVNYLSLAQYKQIINQWNEAEIGYENNKTIHGIFETQVEKTPNNVALVFEEKTLTYQELNSQANQLASDLRDKHNIKKNDLIALCLNRSDYIIISILAVLKAGGTYIPIDPSYPDERIKYILDDTSAKLVLTNQEYKDKFKESIIMENIDFSAELVSNLVNLSTGSDLAYLIYTSGTTGNPKGVMIEHKSCIACIEYIRNTYFKDKLKLDTYSITSYVFDIFVLEYGLSLLGGGSFSVGNNNFHSLDCCNYDFIQMTPSLGELKIADMYNLNNGYFLIGGESLPLPLLQQLLAKDINVIHVYGPTETTIWSISKLYSSSCKNVNKISLGKVFNSEQAYILDSNLRPVPIGAIGDLYIGGVGLSRGYFNRDDLTKDKFINSPFELGKKIYKTGDLAKWSQEGEIEYIGRNDFQVKIRGHRIELEEIEAALLSYNGIKQAVVLAQESKNSSKYLVGYYVADVELDKDDILKDIENKLPEYMLPSILVYMNKLPVSINGKINRKALPNPEFMGNINNYIAPRSDLEVSLNKIWSEILKIQEEKIGIQDDFFRLGGNSILAIKLIAKLNRGLDSNLQVSSIFKNVTIEKLANYISSTSNEKKILIKHSAVSRPEAQLLSFAQERLWFIDCYQGRSNAYNIPMVFKLKNHADSVKIESAIMSIIERHEILRTIIKNDIDGNSYQATLSKSFELERSFLSDQSMLNKELKKQFNYIFDLSNEYPIKVCIHQVAEEIYLSIVVHHIVFDGWSIDIFLKELEDHYFNKPITKLEIQYKDFALWQRNFLSGERLTKELDYWQNKLVDYEPLNLITDKSRPQELNYQGANYNLIIEKRISIALRDIAKELKVSLYSLTVSAYYLMLRAYSNQSDIIIGTPIASRNHQQIENLMGFFVNSLALRSKINPENSLHEYILSVSADVISAQLHQDLPFEKLVEELKAQKDTSRHPIFQVMFGIYSFGIRDSSIIEEYKPKESLYNVAKFDLSTFIEDTEEELKLIFNYATSLYGEETISRFAATYILILEQIVEYKNKLSNIKISDLSYLSKAQYQEIIENWNSAAKDFPRDKTIAQLFEEQVIKTPNNIALIFENIKFSYSDLNEKSNQLAHYLKENYAIKSDDLIALCLDRSEYMLISMLAVLKAGAAYVPLDPSYPDERIKYILEDINTKVVLTNSAYANKFKEIIIVDEIDISSQSKINLNTLTSSEDLAYVIYTSGTTGKPKGVMIEHMGLTNLKYFLTEKYCLEDHEVILQFSNYVFDASVEQIILSITNGHTLLLISEEKYSDRIKFYDYLNRNQVTHIHSTPSFLDMYDFTNITSVRRIISGGERLSNETLNKLKKAKCNIINEYGPTETSITALVNIISDNDLSLGKIIANNKSYVLNKDLSLLPVGAIGELYIGGVGLARGYLNRPDLTAEKFIDSPFKRGEKLYKTGDLVRWLKDGNLEYIGRNDFQVKIRGFRIELGEIETALSSYNQIKQSVVLVKENKQGMKYLVGYYTADKELSQENIFNYLEQHLPSYMIPSILVYLNKLPLTINGKIDLRSLPEIDLYNEENYVAPRNDLEENFAKVWSEVLDIAKDKIGVRDNFFRLGGNSILAIKLISKLNRVLGLKLQVASIFKNVTIEKLAKYLSSVNGMSEYSIVKSNVTRAEEQLLSFAQERLWFIDCYEGRSNAYNIPMVFKLRNHTDSVKIESAIMSIIERHEILRTIIKNDIDENSYQATLSKSFELERSFLSDQSMLNKELKKQFNYIFDLSSEYPIKVCFYELGKETYISIVVHHIAFDGWSIDIFLKELEDYYFDKPIPKLDIQYKDFALWQRNFLSGERLSKEIAYWKNKLIDYESLNLVTDKVRPKEINYEGGNYNFVISEDISIALRDIAKELEVSLYSVVLSAYYLMLKIYSNQNDIIIGTPVASRNYTEIEGLIGFFINSLALRSKINSKDSLQEYILSVSADVISAQLHQDLPFEKLVEELKVEKDTSRHPIFQVMFSLQSFGANQSSILEEYKTKENLYNIAKFDLGVFIDDSNPSLKGNFNYATSLYGEETISRFAATYLLILEQISKNKNKLSNIKISELSYLSKAQYQEIIENWNSAAKDFPRDKTIHQVFEEQVIKTPNNIALIFENIKFSYSDLNERSNQLAHYLKENYVIKPDDLIALCLDRSEYMLISILAVLKAGAAYVPIDPSYPEDRIKYILKDTSAKVVLTNAAYASKFKETIIVEELDLSSQSNINLNSIMSSENLAYVIYTSGTTGNPKGVMIEHKSVINLCAALYTGYDLDKVTNPVNCLWYANYVFDGHVAELYTPLLSGNVTYLIGDETRKDINLLKDYITKYNLYIGMIPPAMQDETNLIELNTLIVAGEKISQNILEAYYSKNIKLINAYGPTESTVCVSLTVYGNHSRYSDIGKPIDNIKVYVLDKDLSSLPVGAIGELYVGGAGLARGYLNRPDLTAEKFIDSPFKRGEKLYKTGDLVRWLKDGNLEYIGRNDFQVKIRGFRIELGEIETALSSYSQIKQSVVLVKENKQGMKYLVGYYTADKELDQEDIFNYLEQHLPDYMIPGILVYLDKLPLTINGKIDLRSLPEIDLYNEENYVAPRNDLEETFAKVWSEVLDIAKDKIGVRDNFFRLGGNSILAIKLISKLNRILDSKLEVASIFKNVTIEKLAKYLSSANGISEYSIVKSNVTRSEEQLLSFAQERLWFIDCYEGRSNAYNIPMIFKLRKAIDSLRIEAAIHFLIHRHEILRTVIREDSEGNSYQLVLESSLNISKESIKDKSKLDQELEKQFNYIFDLSSEYPIKVCFYELEKETYISIVVHHIAFDGWSIDIFLKELEDYYFDKPIPKLDIQYKDFALWQRNFLSGERLNKEIAYWKNKLVDYESLNLVTDKVRPKEINYQGGNYNFVISEDISIALRDIAKELEVSLYSVVLSAYYLMLKIYSNQNDIIIGTPIASRNYTEIEGLIGFFINSLALRSKINPENSLKEYILSVSADVISAQLHQDLPFEKLVEELKLEKDTSRHPIFQVMFSLQSFGANQSSILEEYKTKENLYNIAKFDLGVFIDDSNPSLKGNINYATSLYGEETISRFVATYLLILEQIVEYKNKLSNIKISDLSYLSKAQYQEIIENWNSAAKDFPRDKTIHQVFEEQVERTPDNIALAFEDKHISYRELNERSNQLAHYLKENYVIKPDDLIALCLDRSEYMLISMLAVLKAGAAYVPIDPSYPEERIKYILEDTSAKVVLTNAAYASKFKETIIVEELDLSSQPNINLNSIMSSENLAYVIYTSGTTGNPKGVMIEHRSVVNLLLVVTQEFGLGTENNYKNCLWYANYVFDAHVFESYPSLLYGHTIHLLSSEIKQDMELLNIYIKKNNIYIAMIPSALLDQNKILALNTLIVGGDKTNQNILDAYLNQSIKVINAYGPTESTVCVSLNHYKNNGSMNIGRPISNIKVYILDSSLNPMPVGAIGELYIGGNGLARGYLNRYDLTTEKFIDSPFKRGEKLYKTGDLVRWLKDGSLEYIGRNDFQVKIRGNRIELGEVEAAMCHYDGVKQAIALVNESIDGVKHLIAYYVADQKLDDKEFLLFLEKYLPNYMLPSILIYLEKLPMTVGEKIDKKSLPIPEFSVDKDHYLPPRNEIESKVCKIWCDVLNISDKELGIKDDFFKLGGDSIISIQLVSKIRQVLNIKITVKDIFDYKTIEKLYDNIFSKVYEHKEIISEQGILTGEVNLLPIQKWFFKNNFPAPHHWNQSFLLKVKNLDIKKLELSIYKLQEQHDAFRLRYKDGKQYYSSDIKKIALKTLDIRTVNLDEMLTLWQKDFDLEKGPLHNVAYLYGYSDGSARIFFAMHHLIIDTVSWRILAEDLENLYNGQTLNLKGSSYRQWSNAIALYTGNNSERNYWKNVLVDFDNTQIKKLNIENEHVTHDVLSLTAKQTTKLLKNCNQAYNTQINDLLLTALAHALSEILNNNVNHITLEGHGREEIDDSIDITRTVGWFTTMYPVRIKSYENIADSIKYNKEYLRQVPKNGIGYGAIFGYVKDELPKISFNYLGQFSKDKQSKFWNIIEESTGQSLDALNNNDLLLNINGAVIDNVLHFDIFSKFNAKLTTKFILSFKYFLELIISHCSNKTTVINTMSDFKNFDPYITLHEDANSNNKILFMFPPGDGGAESYFNNIVPQLDNFKLVLFNNYYYHLKEHFPGLDTTNKMTYEELAKEYITYIETIQPKGPYNLFGWSFGGLLAVEIAKQLANKGQVIQNIILLDPYFNYGYVCKEMKYSAIEITENINAKYSPEITDILLNANILLFKATKEVSEIKSLSAISKHYVENAKSNYLDEILKEKGISVIPVKVNHYNIVKNKDCIKKFCYFINKLMSGDTNTFDI